MIDVPVITSIRHRTGVIELNRPKALNSLNLEMVSIIVQALRAWADDAAVDQVLVYSNHPKAFCAGGDVRAARDGVLSGNAEDVDHFFAAEYDMNELIADYPKPYIAVIDGVAMGGGLGISAQGSHRIVTANAFASMPEMVIGYITDVGMAYMSQRVMSPALAKFWGLTGYRMFASDLLFSGIATGYVEDPAAYIDAVIEKGVDNIDCRADVLQPAPLEELIEDIEAAFVAGATWGEILAACSPRLREMVEELTQAASPLSIEASLYLYDFESECATVGEALAAEKRLGAWMIRQPDFAEGVRAVLVDKKKDAQFLPAGIVEPAVLKAVIAGHLAR